VEAGFSLGGNFWYLVLTSNYGSRGVDKPCLAGGLERRETKGALQSGRLCEVNSQSRAIRGRGHTHDVAKDFREVTLIGKADANSRFKNTDSRIVEKVLRTSNPPSRLQKSLARTRKPCQMREMPVPSNRE
jgi:hypothetical protein